MKHSPLIFCLVVSFYLTACGQGVGTTAATEQASLGEEVGDEPIDAPASPTGDLSNPDEDKDFATLPDGQPLSSIKVSGVALSLSKGNGTTFTAAKQTEYEKLKKDSTSNPTHAVQWTFMDMDAHRVIAKSAASGKKIFGASSSKIYVAAALLDFKKGKLSSSQLQLMADMLVVSSNTAWTNLQTQLGDGDANKGRERNADFTKRMGYPLTRGYQGYLGSLHGNELVPDEAAETLYDIYTGGFPGAEILWKLMHTCRTGASRGRKYIPQNIYVGGKTGTYDGATENPETGKQYNVKIRNHLMVFNIGGRQYGLAILANSGSDESAALLAGGLIREYAGVP